jgi:hypothetical protein
MAPRFSVLIWAGIAIGLMLGCCGYYACSYVSRHLHVEWSE